jgi:hypothetical protein
MVVGWSGTVAMKEFWDLAKYNLTTEEIYKLILATNNEGYTVWHVLVFWCELVTMKEIWDLAKDNLTI